MLFRKQKIKENKKLPFRGRHQSSDFSVWDGMSFIEKIAMILLPCMLCFMFYIMLDITGLIWWIRLIISVVIVGCCIGLITLLVNLFTGNDW